MVIIARDGGLAMLTTPNVNHKAHFLQAVKVISFASLQLDLHPTSGYLEEFRLSTRKGLSFPPARVLDGTVASIPHPPRRPTASGIQAMFWPVLDIPPTAWSSLLSTQMEEPHSH